MPFIGKQSTSNSQITNYTTTVGSGGQTNFTVVIEGGDETHVYLNGVLLKETTDYTVSSTQVSLVSAAAENDIVEIKVFRSFALADAVRATGGTFSGDVTVPIIQTDSIKDDSGTRILASDSGSAWSWGEGVPAGTVLQVKQGSRTDATTLSPSSSFIDIGLSVSITPSSSSNKILVIANIQGGGRGGTNSAGYVLVRGSTKIGQGDSAGSRTLVGGVNMSNDDYTVSPTVTIQNFDSPSTTSATTYKVQVYSNSTVYLNRGYNDSDTATNFRGASFITAMEVSV